MVNAGPVVDVAIGAGEGLGLVVDPLGSNGHLDGCGLADVVHAVDVGVENHVAHSQLSAINEFDAAGGDIVVIPIEGIALEGPHLGAAVPINNSGHVEDSQEDVLGNAVAVVVDDLQPLAVVAAVKGFLLLGEEVLLLELVPAVLVGQVLQGGGAGVHFAEGVVVDDFLVRVGGPAVSGGEDLLHDRQIGARNLGVGPDGDDIDAVHGFAVLRLNGDGIGLAILLPVSGSGQLLQVLNPTSVGGFPSGVGLDAVAQEPVGLVPLEEVLVKVDEVLGVAVQRDAAAQAVNSGAGALAGQVLVVLDGVPAHVLQAGEDSGALHVGVTELADVGQLRGHVQGVGLAVHVQAGLALRHDSVGLQVGPLVRHDDTEMSSRPMTSQTLEASSE